MAHDTINSEQGHWVLAKMGKTILRPGGKELTETLVNSMEIKNSDSVVEFAPGMGITASLLIGKNPKKYTGIELNKEAAEKLQKKYGHNGYGIVNTSASNTGLEDSSVNQVIGEAMLTMQADHRKAEIIREAYRILKPGGVYGIHEMGLMPDNIGADVKKDIQQGLSKTIKVNARPLCKSEWCALLEKEGFKIKVVEERPMALLQVKRVLADEGLLRTLKIGFNVLTHPKERKKIFTMRKIFTKYKDHLTSYAIIAEK